MKLRDAGRLAAHPVFLQAPPPKEDLRLGDMLHNAPTLFAAMCSAMDDAPDWLRPAVQNGYLEHYTASRFDALVS